MFPGSETCLSLINALNMYKILAKAIVCSYAFFDSLVCSDAFFDSLDCTQDICLVILLLTLHARKSIWNLDKTRPTFKYSFL